MTPANPPKPPEQTVTDSAESPIETYTLIVMSESTSPMDEQSEAYEWLLLTPQERWLESMKLWETFLALGGSLEPQPDTQSPFYFAETASTGIADGRAGDDSVRRG